MDANLAKHKATPSLVGNHFNPSDLASRRRVQDPRFWDAEHRAARAGRIFQAQLANARAAGRGMARLAETYARKQTYWLQRRDIRELFTEPHSQWVEGQWSKYQVHASLREFARKYLLKVLGEKGWRL